MTPPARSFDGRGRDARHAVDEMGMKASHHHMLVSAPSGLTAGARALGPGHDHPELRCPKHMVHGPCGGVQADGGCEVGGPCAFIGPGAPAIPLVEVGVHAPATLAAQEFEALMRRRQVIVVDLPSPGPDPDMERRLASAVAGKVDATLLGDSPWARLQLSPAVRASIVAGEGVRPWAGLNCRDRNRVALRSELAALAAVGVPAVHCVTGDHPRAHGSGAGGSHSGGSGAAVALRGTGGTASATGAASVAVAAGRGAASGLGQGAATSAPGVFDLDSTQLVGLAATTGLVVSVAESPAAPPIHGRPLRAASKAQAGAQVCFVNHAGDAKSLAHFVSATRALSPKLRIIVCVPMVISRAGADRLSAFLPGPLPAAVRESLEARDPVSAAISATVSVATDYLGIDGVDGVDLSAPAGPGEEVEVAHALASVGRVLGGGS